MRESSLLRRGQRGSVLLLYTAMTGFLVLLVGLAIDVSMLYIAQGQLQTAVDGAARGAVRLVGSDANETEIAKEFVKANMPTGYWWTNNLTVTKDTVTSNITQSAANVTATVQVPTLFMHWLGLTSATVAASGAASVWRIFSPAPCRIRLGRRLR